MSTGHTQGQPIARSYRGLMDERDQLLKALEALDASLEKAWRNGNLPASVIDTSVIAQYRAAIAKAKGAA